MVQTRIEVFPEIEEMVDFFETLPEYDPAMYVHKKMKTTKESALEVLKRTASAVGRAGGLYQRRTVCASAFLCGEKKGCKNGYVLWPVRTAVSGKQMTPAGATEIMEILGKEESLSRIRKGIELLEQA